MYGKVKEVDPYYKKKRFQIYQETLTKNGSRPMPCSAKLHENFIYMTVIKM